MYKTLVKSDGVPILSVLVWNGRGRISSARAVRSSSEWSIGGAIVVNAPEIVSGWARRNRRSVPAGKMISDSGIRKLAELAFAHKASAMDFKVSKPYGDSERYDFVVDSGKRLWRVQVKCTTRLNGMWIFWCAMCCRKMCVVCDFRLKRL